jgi:2-iminobutanoate/2-iminopropanoate deaminase
MKRHNPVPVLPAYVSGQVGVGGDGRTVEGGFDAQCGQAIANVEAVLASAGMALGDIVKVTIYLTRREDIPRLRDIRAERLAVAPTVTMVLVGGLHAPDWLVEIEAVAAAA